MGPLETAPLPGSATPPFSSGDRRSLPSDAAGDQIWDADSTLRAIYAPPNTVGPGNDPLCFGRVRL